MTGLSMGLLLRAYDEALRRQEQALAERRESFWGIAVEHDQCALRWQKAHRQARKFHSALYTKMRAAEQPHTCETCRWWEEETVARLAGWCTRAETIGLAHRYQNSLAWEWNESEAHGGLVTMPKFGCNQWEAK